MVYLDFEEDLEIKKIAEKYCHLKEDKEKFNLLKGSLEIEKKNYVKELLKEKKYHYKEVGKEKEARCFCIGKVIVILSEEKNTIKEVISLKPFDAGIEKYEKFVGGSYQVYMEQNIKEREKIDKLVDEFNSFGKGNKLEKGKIIEEIENILTENKELGKKTDIWKRMGISNSDKSILSKRYNLFLEFKDDELFADNKNYMRAIEDMVNDKVKDITKGNRTKGEKEEMILQEILEIEGRA